MASPAIPVGSIWPELLKDALGKEEGAAVAASLGCCEVVIRIATSEKGQASGQAGKKTDLGGAQNSGVPSEGHGDVKTGITNSSAHDSNSTAVPIFITEEPDSVLHVVAAAGDSKRHLTCARKIYEKASHLLTTAAAQNSKGDTPLHRAARAGNTKMVGFLIKLVDHDEARRALVRMQNKLGETALHEAIRCFDKTKMVKDLMDADEKLAEINAGDGTSPLYLASLLGHAQCVRWILNRYTSYSGPRGQNALHAAVLHNNKEITELLLNCNKELVRKTDINGSTPLHFAASAPGPSLQFTLFVFSETNFERYSMGFYCLPPKWLMKLYGCMNLQLLQLLVADPRSVFKADNHGSFPVHVAAAAGCMVPLIILLTKYPGCAGLRDADGRTFLHIAVLKKRANAVRFVRLWWKQPFSSKSVVNIQDRNGDTALHLAVRNSEVTMFRYLISHKHVHLNLENNKGKTPMDLAVESVKPGFYFGLSAPRRILDMLTFAGALAGSHRGDQIQGPPLDEKTESDKIKDFAQIVGIGSVLVSTATFTAALTMPGGVWSPGDTEGNKKVVAAAPPLAGTPVLNGSYAFDGFVISNTLAFICSTLATFSLVYCGVAAVDIQKRIKLVSLSLALLLCSARSFCAAFAFALYMLLAKVAHGTAVASILMTSFALLDALWFLLASFVDTGALIHRKALVATLWKLGAGFLVNLLYLFWPYLVIGGYMSYDFLKISGKLHGLARH